MKSKLLANITPGEILAKEFLEPMGISQYQLAKDLAIPRMRISKIVRGVLGISADTAVRLGKYFDMDPQFWLNLQSHYDLKQVKAKLGKVLDKEVKIRVAA